MVRRFQKYSHHDADVVERGAANHLGRCAHDRPNDAAHLGARSVEENQVARVEACERTI